MALELAVLHTERRFTKEIFFFKNFAPEISDKGGEKENKMNMKFKNVLALILFSATSVTLRAPLKLQGAVFAPGANKMLPSPEIMVVCNGLLA